ncbi:MAG: hypothetical protein JWP64_4255 [Pseudonocardia sp.]|uniref:hypothetical protein n=1 Tax=Pseudonocardia sp. TaxID=60912 RepID=UPI00261DAC7E|nr:hypothetical protein [Pseudonocardia sp.]MCU1629306.1 hypothetical protein [Pseudonocardia sp.]MDT7703123.1 hypothetical protein [Pseudonocardiales bacterium]HEV7471958.1 hypothetical protein [Pseudonocardia sp.]
MSPAVLDATVLDPAVPDAALLDPPRATDPGRRQRLVRTRLDGGMDAVHRVVTLLRGRGYEVRGMSVDLRRGTLDVTLLVTPDETALLLERLRRLPSVLAAAA